MPPYALLRSFVGRFFIFMHFLTFVACGETPVQRASIIGADETNISKFDLVVDLAGASAGKAGSFFADVSDTNAPWPCVERSFKLNTTKSLFETGWSLPNNLTDDQSTKAFELKKAFVYRYAACRDERHEALVWFSAFVDLELSVTKHLLSANFSSSKLALLVEVKSLANKTSSYFVCRDQPRRVNVSGDIRRPPSHARLSCKATKTPSEQVRGPMSFVSNPGAYAAVAAYWNWKLPAVAADQASFEVVKSKLLQKVPEGTYNGGTTTRINKCKISVAVETAPDGASALVLTYRDLENPREERLEAKNLRGFVEGKLYSDPRYVAGQANGEFAAAEFASKKGGSVFVRFERSVTHGKAIYFDGGHDVCRFLVAN